MIAHEDRRIEVEADERGMTAHEFVSRYWLTMCTVGGVAAIVAFVPQVRHLFAAPLQPIPGDLGIWIGLWLYIGALTLLYLFLGWWVVPREHAEPRQTGLTSRGLRKRALEQHAQISENFRASIGEFKNNPGQSIAGTLAIIAAAAGAVAAYTGVFDDFAYFDSSVLLTLAILAFAWAVILLARNWFHPLAWTMLRRALLAVSVLTLAGELLWVAIDYSPLLSNRNYTIWALLHIMFCAVVFARVMDTWQSLSKYPVRVVGLIVVAALAGSMLPVSVGREEARSSGTLSRTSDAQLTEQWLSRVRVRLDSMPTDGPVVLVAASGGGSRAALFTSLVLEDLGEVPIDFPHVEDEESAKSIPYRVNDHVLLISSVSGGTLGSAWYVANAAEHRGENAKAAAAKLPLKNSTLGELIQDMQDEADTLAAHDDKSDIQQRREVARLCAQMDGDDPATLPTFFARSGTDQMCTDFMAPLLRGVLHFGAERGEAVTSFWQRKFSLKETNLTYSVDGPTAESVPLLLCNAATVEHGSQFVIGFPPLPPDLLKHRDERTELPQSLTGRYADKERLVELTLGQVVRLSANFPWGFSVAEVGQGSTETHLVDGGVFDNTGIGTIRHLLAGLLAMEQRNEQAADVLSELKRRGVILLEIDSGAKPQPPGLVTRLFSTVFEPLRALENAGYAGARLHLDAHRTAIGAMLPDPKVEELKRELERISSPNVGAAGDQIEIGEELEKFLNVKHITIQCNHEENVMTAWALGPEDKARILVRYMIEKESVTDELHSALRILVLQKRKVLQEALSATEALAGGDPAENAEDVERILGQLRETAKHAWDAQVELESKGAWRRLEYLGAEPAKQSFDEPVWNAQDLPYLRPMKSPQRIGPAEDLKQFEDTANRAMKSFEAIQQSRK